MAVHLRPRRRDLGQHRLGVHEQVGAGRGQLDAARGPPKQRQPELRLQPPDLLRERRLGDVERLGRAREVPVARDRREVLELPQLHDARQPQVGDAAAGLEHERARLGLPAAVPVLERALRERDVDDHLLAGVGLDDGEAREPARRPLDALSGRDA